MVNAVEELERGREAYASQAWNDAWRSLSEADGVSSPNNRFRHPSRASHRGQGRPLIGAVPACGGSRSARAAQDEAGAV